MSFNVTEDFPGPVWVSTSGYIFLIEGVPRKKNRENHAGKPVGPYPYF